MAEEIYTPRKTRRTKTLDIRGVAYNVSEWGRPENPLLVLLHGFADAGACFQFVVDALRKDWFVIAPDWRGFGASTYRTTNYWFPDYLADLDALLAHYSPEEPVRLVGHSMGANIGAIFAGVFPERVSQFVNIEGFGLRESDPVDSPARLRHWIESGRNIQPYTTYQEFSELAVRIRKRSPHLSEDRALYVARQWAARDADGVIRLKIDPAHRLRNPVLYRRREAEASWSRVKAPVLFVVGGDTDFDSPEMRWVDGKTPFGNFPDLQHVTVEDARHMVHFEQPDRLAAVLEDFLTY